MAEVIEAALADKPAHVPNALVFDFDLFAVRGSSEDVHAAYHAIQQNAPDIFWTPRNGGHWVATRSEDIMAMQLDHGHFSHRDISIPPMPAEKARLIPLELDPPEHPHYRKPLTFALTPAAVRDLEAKVRLVAIDTIERLQPNGHCEFIHDFANVLPIHVFLDMVQLPLSDKDYLLQLGEKVVRVRDPGQRYRAQQDLGIYLDKWVTLRRDEPGDDLLSKLVNLEIGGQRIDHAEAISYASLVLFGGLDTVASMLGFFARFLALNSGHRRQLVERLDDDKFVSGAIEEMMRRHGIANTARVVVGDITYKDLHLVAGDRVLPANLFVGLDDRINPEPLTVDFQREKPVHAVFGNGAHACPGAALARRELRVFLQEWLKRIPDFEITPGTVPALATGMTNAVVELQLSWSTE